MQCEVGIPIIVQLSNKIKVFQKITTFRLIKNFIQPEHHIQQLTPEQRTTHKQTQAPSLLVKVSTYDFKNNTLEIYKRSNTCEFVIHHVVKSAKELFVPSER